MREGRFPGRRGNPSLPGSNVDHELDRRVVALLAMTIEKAAEQRSQRGVKDRALPGNVPVVILNGVKNPVRADRRTPRMNNWIGALSPSAR